MVERGGMRWQLQDAKQRFSEVVRSARREGPQIVTRHGEEVAVVVSMEEYRRLTSDKPAFKEFILAAPDLGVLEVKRSSERARIVEVPPR